VRNPFAREHRGRLIVGLAIAGSVAYMTSGHRNLALPILIVGGSLFVWSLVRSRRAS
jgi:hypothetical protein